MEICSATSRNVLFCQTWGILGNPTTFGFDHNLLNSAKVILGKTPLSHFFVGICIRHRCRSEPLIVIRAPPVMFPNRALVVSSVAKILTQTK